MTLIWPCAKLLLLNGVLSKSLYTAQRTLYKNPPEAILPSGLTASKSCPFILTCSSYRHRRPCNWISLFTFAARSPSWILSPPLQRCDSSHKWHFSSLTCLHFAGHPYCSVTLMPLISFNFMTFHKPLKMFLKHRKKEITSLKASNNQNTSSWAVLNMDYCSPLKSWNCINLPFCQKHNVLNINIVWHSLSVVS